MSEAQMSPAIQLRRVVKRFKNAAGEFVALRGVDLDLYPGEFVAIVGKSGSGKSTLLNMITGIDHPTTGQVLVDGVDIYKMSESQRALWRGRNLGIVFQFFQLLPSLTVLENVRLPMDFAGAYPAAHRNERAMHLLELVEMADHAHQLPRRLSGGQQQSVAIARAMANDPLILAADEPTGNLDSRSAELVFRLFEKLAAGGKTIMMVTHDNDLAARAQRTIILADGRIVAERMNVRNEKLEVIG